MNFDLTKSKSTWGGIGAIVVLLVRQILIHNGVIIPFQEWDLAILLIDAVAAAFGIYGFRDAIRKLQVDQYYQDPLKKNIPKNDTDNLGQLEQDYQNSQYKENERVKFTDNLPAGNYNKDKNIIAQCSETGEPTFCLRAKDVLALEAIAHYYDLTKQHECNSEFIRDINAIYERFKLWREMHPFTMKLPD